MPVKGYSYQTKIEYRTFEMLNHLKYSYIIISNRKKAKIVQRVHT